MKTEMKTPSINRENKNGTLATRVPCVFAAAACAGLAMGVGISAVNAQPTTQPGAPSAQVQQQLSPAQQEIMQEWTEIRQQLEQVEKKIQAAQQMAIQDPQVQKEQEKFVTSMNEAMTEQAPDAGTLITQRDELLAEIEGSPELKQGAQPGPELQGKIQQFQQIEQQLAPLRQQVSESPDVRESQKVFEQKLVEEMRKVEPEITDILQEQSELIQKFQQLQARARQHQQQQE